MGVKNLFRYISERYPCINETVQKHCIPSFDNLYIDMNGIMYRFKNDDEAQMFKDIFTFIEKVFCLIKPQRLLYMGVDGVAPQAKLNLMRLGRFRVAEEEDALPLQAINRENVEFFSSCITPGTEFMERLHNALRLFVKNKISTDPLWQRCRVILSGHDSPGEGEHKIMDYIRYMKSQKDYDPRTRHCLYGSDADLIILGLCSHELHFAILREEYFSGRRSAMEETQFFLLHLGLLREYLQLEFAALRQYESFRMSKLIDDWVFMTLLFGNDFIPCLEFLDIQFNDMALVHQTYIKVYPKLGGNINENGTLNLFRLEIFMEALSKVEFKLIWKAEPENKEEGFFKDLVIDWDNLTEKEFELLKRYFYTKVLDCEELTPEIVTGLAHSYIEGLQWISHYYYKGVPDWSWCYPYYYPPFISDLKNFKDLKFDLKIGKPLLPFEQLLAVLPATRRSLLPTAYQDLLISPTSEIIHFYPSEIDFSMDKAFTLPFIDMELLLSTMKKCEGDLTPDEVKRNRHGPMLQYDYTPQTDGEQRFCTETPLWNEQISLPPELNPMVELQIPNRNAYVPGFPSLKHLPFQFQLKNAGVKVLAFPSMHESMILRPKISSECNDIGYAKRKLLGRTVYIGWPYMIKAQVVGVSNENVRMTANGTKENNSRMFDLEMKSVREHLLSRLGIEIDGCQVLVHVRRLMGRPLEYESEGKLSTYDVWSEGAVTYPAEIVICDLNVHERYIEPYKPSFGSEGTVKNPQFNIESGKLKVCITVHQNPDLSEPMKFQSYVHSSYTSAYEIQSLHGLSAKIIFRLTSSICIILGERRPETEDMKKVNIGLQMKFPKQNEELFGYTRKAGDKWLFSPNAVATFISYTNKFPMVSDYILRTTTYEDCFESDLFPGRVGEDHVEEIVKWIAEQDFAKAERVPCGTNIVDKKVLEKIVEPIEQIKTLPLRTVELPVHREYPLRLFDRVVVVRHTYSIPIGSTGTIIGIIPARYTNSVRWECVKQISNFLDIYFDERLECDISIYGLGVGRVMRVPEIAVLTIPNR